MCVAVCCGLQEAPRGQLQLHQVSCLTAGLDGGWRLAPYSSSSSTDTTAAALQQAMTPNITLSAGESSMHYVQLLSPSKAAAAAGAAAEAGSGGQLVPLQQGPLQFFYSRGGPTAGQQQQQQQAAMLGGSATTSTAAAAAGGGGGGSDPAGLRGIALEYKQPALVAEPPVDLLVLWRFQPTAAATAEGPTGQQQQQRVGMITFYDLCAAQRLNPVRMTLEGPAVLNPSHQGRQGSSQALVKHDFRSTSLCVIPLKLRLRNCGVLAVSVTVRASDAWQGLSNEHAWFCAPSAPGAKHPGLLGSAGPTTPPPGSPGPHPPPPAAAAAGGGGLSGAYMQQGRVPGAALSSAPSPLGLQPPAAAAVAAPAAAGGYSAGPPPPPAAATPGDGGLPPKSRTPPTSTGGGGLGVLGPAAAAAAEGLGLGGFNLGALAGGLTAGLRFPSPAPGAGSDEAGSAGSSVHGGTTAAPPPPAAAAAGNTTMGGLSLFPATAGPGAVTPIPATATAMSSTATARGGASPKQGPAGGAQALGVAGSLPGQPGMQGRQDSQAAQQRRLQQQQQQQQEVQAGLPPGPDHVWCGVTRVTLESLQPGSSAEVALQVAVFRPGIYVVDDYVVDWQLLEGGGPGGRRRQGSKLGEPAVLRVEPA